MDTVFFICMGAVSFISTIAIIKMVINRLKGRDEQEGILSFKRREKDKE